MDEIQLWNNFWKIWIDSITLQLTKTHKCILDKSPFDTWVHWQSEVPLAKSGWKIHVSPHPEAIHETLNLISELSAKLLFSFKLISSYPNYIKLNSGSLGESQIGKTITIYPHSNEDLFKIFFALRPLCKHLKGPRVPSDFYWEPTDRISVRWGQFGEAFIEYDSFGKPIIKIQTDSGTWVEDSREIPAVFPAGVEPLKFEGQCFLPLKIKTEGPFEINGTVYNSIINYGRKLKQVWLLEHPENKTKYIYKRVWKNMGIKAGSRDALDELNNEFNILKNINSRHNESSIAPKAHHLYETEFFVESLMEDAGGDSLEKLPTSFCRKQLQPLVESIIELHQMGLIHRDLKRRNLVFDNQTKKIKIIDFELAGLKGSELPCSSGTAGYKSVETEKGDLFKESIDNYALGSIIFDLCLSRDPALYLLTDQQKGELLKINGFTKAADLIAKLPTSNLHLIKNEFTEEIFERSTQTLIGASDIQIKKSIETAIQMLPSFYKEPVKGVFLWKNNHLLSRVNHQGINIGAAGIIIGLLDLLDLKSDFSIKDMISNSAEGLIQSTAYKTAQGFMTGNSGVGYALVKAGISLKNERWIELGQKRWEIAAGGTEEFDFFSGLAGIVYSGIKMYQWTGNELYREKVTPLVEKLIQEVVDYEGLWAWPCSEAFGGLPTLGASHGAAGIAMVLAQWGKLINDEALVDFSIEVFQRIYQFGRSVTGHSLRYDVHPESTPRSTTDWCHGSAGYLWSILNSVGNLETLREEINWSKELFINSLISSNTTYCHGLSGQLELALMLKKNNISVDHKINQIQLSLLLQRRHFGDVLTWPSENPEQFTPDLWVGALGPIVALNRAANNNFEALFG